MKSIIMLLLLLTGCATQRQKPRMVGIEHAQAASGDVGSHIQKAQSANSKASGAATRARSANNGIQVSLENIEQMVDALLKGEI